jgi:hypothetical protein
VNVDRNLAQGEQLVAQRNEVVRLLGCHDAGKARCRQNITLGRVTIDNPLQAFQAASPHSPRRARSAMVTAFVSHIHHAGAACFIQMCQPTHGKAAI